MPISGINTCFDGSRIQLQAPRSRGIVPAVLAEAAAAPALPVRLTAAGAASPAPPYAAFPGTLGTVPTCRRAVPPLAASGVGLCAGAASVGAVSAAFDPAQAPLATRRRRRRSASLRRKHAYWGLEVVIRAHLRSADETSGTRTNPFESVAPQAAQCDTKLPDQGEP